MTSEDILRVKIEAFKTVKGAKAAARLEKAYRAFCSAKNVSLDPFEIFKAGFVASNNITKKRN